MELSDAVRERNAAAIRAARCLQELMRYGAAVPHGMLQECQTAAAEFAESSLMVATCIDQMPTTKAEAEKAMAKLAAWKRTGEVDPESDEIVRLESDLCAVLFRDVRIADGVRSQRGSMYLLQLSGDESLLYPLSGWEDPKNGHIPYRIDYADDAAESGIAPEHLVFSKPEAEDLLAMYGAVEAAC